MKSSHDLRKQILKPPSRPPTTPRKPSKDDLSECMPLGWEHFFSHKLQITIDYEKFCVYKLGEKPTVPKEDDDTLAIVLLHGGGFSGLTWCDFAAHLFAEYVCEIFAIDLRGHGESLTGDDYNLSTGTMIRDITAIIDELDIGNRNLVLIGHSMGGAIAVSCSLFLQESQAISATVVLDVVEGSAMDTLHTMPIFLRNRPRGFDSLPASIRWSLKSGHTKNTVCARVSMPGQLKVALTGQPATKMLDEFQPSVTAGNVEDSSSTTQNDSEAIAEEDEESEHVSLTSIREDYSIGHSEGVNVETQELASDSNATSTDNSSFHVSLTEIPENYSLKESSRILNELTTTHSAPELHHSFRKPTLPAWTAPEGIPRWLRSPKSTSVQSAVPGPSTAKHTEASDNSSQKALETSGSKANDKPPSNEDASSNAEVLACVQAIKFNSTNVKYVWRINLMQTEQYWRGWFEGLTKKFLRITCPKQLILAGTDRLDRDMLVAHMQGKFENHILPNCGHVIQEDDPATSASLVGKFLVRHKLTTVRAQALPLRRTIPTVTIS